MPNNRYYSSCVNLRRLRRILAEKEIPEPDRLEEEVESQMKVFVHGLKFLNTPTRVYTEPQASQKMSLAMRRLVQNPIDLGNWIVSQGAGSITGWKREIYYPKGIIKSREEAPGPLLDQVLSLEGVMEGDGGRLFLLESLRGVIPKRVIRMTRGDYAFLRIGLEGRLSVAPAGENPRRKRGSLCIPTRPFSMTLSHFPRFGEARAAIVDSGLLLWTQQKFVWVLPEELKSRSRLWEKKKNQRERESGRPKKCSAGSSGRRRLAARR